MTVKNERYPCSLIREMVTIQRIYESIGEIGSNHTELEPQVEICSKERTCQHLTNCPIRSGDQE